MRKKLIGIVTALSFMVFQIVNVSAANFRDECQNGNENEKLYVQTIGKDVKIISNFNYNDETGYIGSESRVIYVVDLSGGKYGEEYWYK